MNHLAKILVPPAVLLLIYVIPASLGEFTYRWRAYCNQCGVMRQTSELQLPYSRFTLWETHRIEDTAVGRVIRERAIAKNHPHQWVCSRGSGNGIQ